jgi:hypothetical protein
MKKELLSRIAHLLVFQVFFLALLTNSQPAFGQSDLNDDGSSHTINYSGSYVDYLIPEDVTYAQIKLTARGADGGKRLYGICKAKGGGGATAEGTFVISCDGNDLQPGGTIRFIVGQSGTSYTGGLNNGGGGGGGTGILYKAPGSDDWVILAVGGGGGGAFLDGVCIDSDGRVASSTTSGSDGKGNSNGNGGDNGEGGNESNSTASGGGGGAFGDGGDYQDFICTSKSGGEKGGTTGGDGGDDNDCAFGQDGGFGFGGGGLGVYGGGGGGGYSGGGAGGDFGGGGGGGSYVNPIAASSDTEAGETTNDPDHGWSQYQFLSNTGNPIATPINAVCNDYTVQLNYENCNTIYVSAESLAGNSTGGCGSLSFPGSYGFSCGSEGSSYEVSAQILDDAGNSATCNSTITVETIPFAKCKDISVSLNSSGEVTVLPAQVDNGSYDPDGGSVDLAFFLLFDDGESLTLDCNDIGASDWVLGMTDDEGQLDFCTTTITVTDNTGPSLICKNPTINLNSSGSASITTASVYQSGSDNCGDVNLQSVSPNSFTCSNVGANTVVLTANDGNGNTSTCSATVTVRDATAPTVTCKNATVNLNASGTGSITTAAVFQSGADNCGTVNQVSVSPNTFACSNLGANLVTLTVNDGNGNTGTCTATVTVQDITAPTVVCKNATVNLNASGAGSITTASVFQSGSDNCGTVNQVSVSPNTFACSNIGANLVTLTVNDGNGNTNTCTATVTVLDATAPTVTCQNATVNLNASGAGSITTAAVFQSGADNCGAVNQVSVSPNTFACGNIGANMVTLTVNDGHGNTGTCTATVTVQDVTAPTVVCKNATVNLNASGVGSITTAAVFQSGADNCGAVNQVSVSPNTVACGNIGTNLVTLTVNDGHGNTATCTATVTVQDVTAPTVVCQNATVNLNASGAGSITTATVFQSGSDNCGAVNQVSVSPNTFACGNIGTNLVTLTVNDGHGNTSNCTATVTVQDVTAPTVICQNATVNLNASGAGSITTATVFQSGSDNCGAVNQVSVSPNTFACGNIGTNLVTLTVNDGHGNTNTCTATVTVRDAIAPTMLCRNATISLNANGQATLTVAQINNGSYDNCGIVTLNLSPTTFTCANIGSNPVQLTGSDASGNKNECSATVTVTDPIAPVARCKNVTANLGANGTVTVAAASVNNGSTDNCSFSMSLTPGTFTCNNLGVNIVIFRATDPGGNTSTCSATVTVRDQTAPTASCKNATIYLNNDGQATLTVNDINNGSSDNCSLSTMTLSRTQFNCSDIPGALHTVTLTLKDASNNTASCNAGVTVKDNIAPSAICENTVVTLGLNGTATVYGAELAGESSDNCSVWSYSPVARVYTAANIGNNNLTITVKDWSGNSSTCVSVVTVEAYGGGDNNVMQGREEATKMAASVQLTLFPNPAASETHIRFELPTAQTCTLRIFDLGGKQMLLRDVWGQEGENVVNLPLSGFESGIYILDFQTETGKEQKRLVVQRN